MRYSNKKEIIKIINSSASKAEFLNKLNLATKGGNYRTLNNFIIENKIDVSHFGHFFKKYTKKELKKLIEESTSFGQVTRRKNFKKIS